TRPDRSGIALQPEYRWKSRYNLVVLLSKCQNDLALGADTLFLAVNILDRYSSKRIVKRCHCKLLGGVALLLASKYLNRLSTASSFRERCCLFSGYELQDITQMEKMVLLTLDYLVGFPAVIGFMQIELLDFQQLKPLYDMVLYICELTLCYSEFLSTPAALIARAAVETASRLIGRP
ncbi:cyclin-like protein, partial [Aureobasidium melanogenum CBS 110374]